MSDTPPPTGDAPALPIALRMDRVLYRAAVGFGILNGIGYALWVAMYLTAIFFPSSAGWAGPDTLGYVTSLPLYRHAFIYVAAIMAWAAIVFVALRHRWTPPIYIAAVLAATVDWIETGLTPRTAMGLTDPLSYIHLIIYSIAGSLALLMWHRGMFRAAR